MLLRILLKHVTLLIRPIHRRALAPAPVIFSPLGPFHTLLVQNSVLAADLSPKRDERVEAMPLQLD